MLLGLIWTILLPMPLIGTPQEVAVSWCWVGLEGLQASLTHTCGLDSHFRWLPGSPVHSLSLEMAPHLQGLPTWPLSSRGPKYSYWQFQKKKQSQRLLNILRPMPGAVIGHVVPASLRASPGSRLERTLERFIAGWPGCTVQESAEACGTYCVDPQCVWVWGVRTGWWGMKSFYSKWVS